MAKRSRRRVLEHDLVANPTEVADFLRAFGRTPSKPVTVTKVAAPRKKAPAAKPRRIRNPAEAKWLAEVWAAEAEARRADKKSNVDNNAESHVDKTPFKPAAVTWWHDL